jgi:hypothetical protein
VLQEVFIVVTKFYNLSPARTTKQAKTLCARWQHVRLRASRRNYRMVDAVYGLKLTGLADPKRIALSGDSGQQLAATQVKTTSTLGRALKMTTQQPDRLSSVTYRTNGRKLLVTFEDGRSFSLPLARLGMPVVEIDWPTTTVSPDGTAMIVRETRGKKIPVDAGAVRCMVDKDYAARAKAAVDALRPTREELHALSKVSERPAKWDDEPAQGEGA